MNRIQNVTLSLLLAAAVAANAQGPRGPQTPAGAPQGTGLNLSAAKVVSGVVSEVSIGYGAQYPTIVISQTQIKLAPAWFLLDADIEIKTGDTLKIMAAPSNNTADKYLYAIEVTKGSAYLKLRDAAGLPLWMSGMAAGNGQHQTPQGTGYGNGNVTGNRSGECQGCLDGATVTTVSGTVDKITAGVGIQFPSLVLATADGKLLTLRVGPERVLLAADFEITAGQKLTVTYAASTCKDELVVLTIADTAGHKIVLRNADGSPAWN